MPNVGRQLLVGGNTTIHTGDARDANNNGMLEKTELDLDGDGVVTHAELDADGDGVIEFHELDADGDGQIDMSELKLMVDTVTTVEDKKFKGVYWGSSVAAPGETPSDGITRVSELFCAH